MKKKRRNIILLLGISILFLGILFLSKPKLWLKIVNPLKYEIIQVDTHIQEDEILLNFDLIINSDYLLPFFFDSIEYEVRMDSTLFSTGKKTLSQQYKMGSNDTIQLPLKLDLNKLKEIMKSKADQDSLNLQITFKSFIKLPLAGTEEFDYTLERKIPQPNPPKFTVINLEKKSMSLHDAKFDLHFRLENPNYYEINIESIHVDLNYPKLFTGVMKCSKPFKLPAQSSVERTANIDINDLNLVRDGLKVVFQPKKKWEFHIDAELKIRKDDGSIMPMKITSSGEMELMGRRKSKK